MLAASHIEAFQRDGFVKGPQVLGERELQELRDELDRVLRDRERTDVPQPSVVHSIGQEGHPLWQVCNIWLASEAYRRLFALCGLGEAAAALIGGTSIRLWHDQIQYKPSGVGGSNHWHQDWPYWPSMAAPEAVTAWIAIDDADVDNGCMRMVPGSHRWGKAIDHLHCVGDLDNIAARYQDHEVAVRMCPVRAGEVHLHHCMTWHASHANTSGRPRRAIAIHLMNERALAGEELEHADERRPLLWADGRPVEVRRRVLAETQPT